MVPAFAAAEGRPLDSEPAWSGYPDEVRPGLASAFTVATVDGPGLDTAASVCEHHRDLELGLADASTFVLADRWRTTALATFDERHSRAILPLGGGAFELLPADAS